MNEYFLLKLEKILQDQIPDSEGLNIKGCPLVKSNLAWPSDNLNP